MKRKTLRLHRDMIKEHPLRSSYLSIFACGFSRGVDPCNSAESDLAWSRVTSKFSRGNFKMATFTADMERLTKDLIQIMTGFEVGLRIPN